MKKPLFVLPLVIVISFLSGCSKEKIEPSFPLEYVFINQEDALLSFVSVESATYYPTQDSSSWVGRGFYSPKPTDSLIVPLDRIGYKGCTMKMYIRVFRNEPSGPQSYGRYKVEKTVNSEMEKSFYFHWPVDTLRAERLE